MRIPAKSNQAVQANTLVEGLQSYFVQRLNNVSKTLGSDTHFEEVEWMRDEGRHGGGTRFEARDETIFNRGSVNVSQVHYDDNPDKQLGSATAISTIIHPKLHPVRSEKFLIDNRHLFKVIKQFNSRKKSGKTILIIRHFFHMYAPFK